MPEEALGEVTRYLRGEAGLTQSELARAAGVSAAMIAKIENGSRSPSRNSLVQLATALGVTHRELEDAAHRWAASRQDEGSDVAGVLDSLGVELDPGGTPAAEPSSASTRPADHSPGQELAPGLDGSTAPDELRWLLTSLVGELRHADADRVARLEPLLRSLVDVPTESLEEAAQVAGLVESPWLRSLPSGQREHLLSMLVQDVARAQERTASDPPRFRVANFPPGKVGHLFVSSVARVDDDFWIDPEARAFTTGLADRDPRFERFDDGRVRVDASRLADDIDWPERDPERHVLRATAQGRLSVNLDDLADVYASTVIEITWEDRRLELRPRPVGETEGDFPSDASVVHVLTAQNPQSRLLVDTENLERHRMLLRRLEETGWTFHPAVGRSSDQSWSEEGVAIVDVPVEEVLALGREYEQNAIFEWTPRERAVVWCDHDRPRDPHGWALTEL